MESGEDLSSSFSRAGFFNKAINILLEKKNPSLPQFDFPKLEFLRDTFSQAVGSGQGF